MWRALLLRASIFKYYCGELAYRHTSFEKLRQRVPRRPRASEKQLERSRKKKHTKLQQTAHRFFRRFFRDDDEEADEAASRTRANSSASRRTARQTRRDVTTSRAGGRAPSKNDDGAPFDDARGGSVAGAPAPSRA